MKIEAGKYYKTRDGRKVGPATARYNTGCSDGPWKVNGWNYDDDGKCSNMSPCKHDLIAEWQDEPADDETNFAAQAKKYGILIIETVGLSLIHI